MPGRSRSVRVLVGRDADAHRQALHHLHVVAGRVLRRQQAVARARGAGEALDAAVERRAERVDLDAHRLARRACARSCVSLKLAVTHRSSSVDHARAAPRPAARAGPARRCACRPRRRWARRSWCTRGRAARARRRPRRPCTAAALAAMLRLADADLVAARCARASPARLCACCRRSCCCSTALLRGARERARGVELGARPPWRWRRSDRSAPG